MAPRPRAQRPKAQRRGASNPGILVRIAAVASSLALAASGASAQITAYFGIPYTDKLPSDPTYAESVFDIFYPDGGCPAYPGCPSPLRPVAVALRGGNSNSLYSGAEQVSPIGFQLLQKGFVVVVPAMHVIDMPAGESWIHTTKDAARVVQFLRHYATTLNVDPHRVFVQGHSAGGVHSLFLAYNVDFQDPSSPDPVARESSRPDFVVPWGAPSEFACLDPAGVGGLAAPSWASLYLFGVDDFTLVSLQTKIELSPKTWLLSPALYGRVYTPPAAMVYDLGHQHPCGQIADVHDGKFGPILLEALTRYCTLYGDPGPCSESILLNGTGDLEGAISLLVAWMAEKARV